MITQLVRQRFSLHTLSSIVVILVLLFLYLSPVAAQTATSYFDPGGTISKNSGLPQDDPTDITLNLIKGFLQLMGIIALVLIIYGGFIIMTGGATGEGSPAAVKKGKDIILWSIVGALVILSSLGIIEYIESII